MTIGSSLGESLAAPSSSIPKTDKTSARSTNNVQSFRIEVDLGADEGRPGRDKNQFVLEVKQTCKVRMETLKGYLEKKVGWDNSVLECMSKWYIDRIGDLAVVAHPDQASSTTPSARAPLSACG